ncbi:hypothetical protein [Paenibacillus daejeonensis]|uniref:hypothetical protein n=1 Tax=Paenibacillus daejeonensis TaxID=135193 RepID=UPI0003647E11|nr:hypothetical protein [Paenibacillus daejeonensis]
MPQDSYPFPMYSGLLDPEHYKRIGSAIWLFLWCVSSTTAEDEKEGVVWGIVLGNKPLQLSDIGDNFDVSEKTVSRWLETLKNEGYLRITRTARGLILTVRKSKKNLVGKRKVRVPSDQTKVSDQSENDQTDMSDHNQNEASDQTDMSDHSQNDQTKVSDHSAETSSDRTNVSDLKDLKDLKAITTTTTSETDFRNGLIQIVDAYCKLHGKLDIHIRPREREAMGRMVSGGMPVPFTIRTMELLLEEKRKREGSTFQAPSSFLYYEHAIADAWKNAEDNPLAVKEQPKQKRSRSTVKKQDSIEALRQKAREERARGQS